ncbi:MAG: L-threonylcarbamoyladenylate synthase, partial [Bradymonadaceae bacterium]
MIIQIDSDHPQPRRIRQMVDTLKEGELVAYPTDTVYGVGCDITSHDALVGLREFVSEFKDEPDHAPLSFICESLSQVAEYAHVDDEAHRFLRRALPGPFTFILEASKDVPSVMRKHRDTVGVRIPEHAITARLIERLGNPLATTTAMTREGDLVHDPWTLDDLYGHRI